MPQRHLGKLVQPVLPLVKRSTVFSRVQSRLGPAVYPDTELRVYIDDVFVHAQAKVRTTLLQQTLIRPGMTMTTVARMMTNGWQR